MLQHPHYTFTTNYPKSRGQSLTTKKEEPKIVLPFMFGLRPKSEGKFFLIEIVACGNLKFFVKAVEIEKIAAK